jgi:hypothetical protein
MIVDRAVTKESWRSRLPWSPMTYISLLAQIMLEQIREQPIFGGDHDTCKAPTSEGC